MIIAGILGGICAGITAAVVAVGVGFGFVGAALAYVVAGSFGMVIVAALLALCPARREVQGQAQGGRAGIAALH